MSLAPVVPRLAAATVAASAAVFVATLVLASLDAPLATVYPVAAAFTAVVLGQAARHPHPARRRAQAARMIERAPTVDPPMPPSRAPAEPVEPTGSASDPDWSYLPPFHEPDVLDDVVVEPLHVRPTPIVTLAHATGLESAGVIAQELAEQRAVLVVLDDVGAVAADELRTFARLVAAGIGGEFTPIGAEAFAVTPATVVLGAGALADLHDAVRTHQRR